MWEGADNNSGRDAGRLNVSVSFSQIEDDNLLSVAKHHKWLTEIMLEPTEVGLHGGNK